VVRYHNNINMSVKIKILKVILKKQLFILSIWSLGAIAGASAVNWYYILPTLEETYVFEQKTVSVIEIAEAKEVEDNIEKLMALIYQNESSSGKNNFSKCEEQGKVNGIGYGIPGNGSFVCFESHEEEMIALRGWLVAKRASGMSDEAMLCLYSGGNYVNCKK